MSPRAQIFSEIYQVASFSPFKTKILSPVSTSNNLFENYSPFFLFPVPTRGFPHNTATQRNDSAFRVTGRDGDLHQELGMNSRHWESALLLMRRLVSLGSSPAFGSARFCPVFPSPLSPAFPSGFCNECQINYSNSRAAMEGQEKCLWQDWASS